MLSDYESKVIKFLGKTPTHIRQENLLDYFLYVYEFNWLAPAFSSYRNSIKEHFADQLNELKLKHQDLTLGQEWWALVLLALKDLTQAENKTFASETIQFVLNRIHQLSDKEMEDYCNSINNVLYMEIPDSLSIRPLEIQDLQSSAYKDDVALAYFLNKKEEFIQTFKQYLTPKDIRMKYIQEFLTVEKEIDEKFTDLWNSYFEIFVGFSISMFDLFLQSPLKSLNIDAFLKEINTVFLVASVQNSSKIDNLNKRLSTLMKPLYINE